MLHAIPCPHVAGARAQSLEETEMKTLSPSTCLALSIAATTPWAGIAPVSTVVADTAHADRMEVVEKVQKAAALIENEGEAAFDIINDPSSDYSWKDTYVFAVNCEADRVMANPAYPERVGGDIKQHTDFAGKPYGQELCRIAARPEGGWVEYVWLVPGTTTPRRKFSFVMTAPGTPYQVGAGIYDHDASVEARAK